MVNRRWPLGRTCTISIQFFERNNKSQVQINENILQMQIIGIISVQSRSKGRVGTHLENIKQFYHVLRIQVWRHYI
jgi:hypothetical protein